MTIMTNKNRVDTKQIDQTLIRRIPRHSSGSLLLRFSAENSEDLEGLDDLKKQTGGDQILGCSISGLKTAVGSVLLIEK